MNTGDGDVELLSRAILSEAQAEGRELQTAAEARADDIRRRAHGEADRERQALLEQAAREAERLRSQATATAQLKARSKELEHREQLLDGVFERARELLKHALERKDYEQVVVQLIREGIRNLNSPEVQVLADGATSRLLGEPLLQQVGREAQVGLGLGPTLDQGTGVILQTPQGHLRFDNTLETRLARLQSTLRAAVYSILMGEAK